MPEKWAKKTQHKKSRGVTPAAEASFDDTPSFMEGGRSGGPVPSVGRPSKPGEKPARRATMDETLAKAIDAMDFEYKEDVRKGKNQGVKPATDDEFDVDRTQTDFNQREVKGNSCWRQIFSFSTFVCCGQIGVLAYILYQDGMVPVEENSNYGPSAYSLVKYGARATWAIKEKGQWYRLISPMCLHAGVIHICTNVAIQLRIGGYLNSLYGTRDWILIYVTSGVFGSLCSTIFLPDNVGVGSSGAVLGLLCSWVVWLVFRWRKIPKEARFKRNLQLMVVSIAIAGTLFFSFSPFTDWAVHFGGAGMGLFIGSFLLCEELDSEHHRWIFRIVSGIIIVGSYLWALWYIVYNVEAEPLFPPNY